MVPVGVGNFLQSSHVAIDVSCMWRQEVSLQLVLQQHVVLRRKAEACSHDVFYAGSLAEKGIDNWGA